MASATQWFEDETFWEAWAPIGFHGPRMLEASSQVEQIIQRLDLKAGAKVLDLCCGVGRHSLELARRGFHVTGVDRNEKFLQNARNRGADEGLRPENPTPGRDGEEVGPDRPRGSSNFVRADMRDFCQPDSFDAAISCWTSFGYFDDHETDRDVARNIRRSLRPRGGLLMELVGKEALARQFQPRRWDESNGVVMCSENRIVDHWRSVQTKWTFFRDGHRSDFVIKVRCYSAVELADLLEDAGFNEVSIFGDLAGSPYDESATRLVVTARRPDAP